MNCGYEGCNHVGGTGLSEVDEALSSVLEGVTKD